ncbi:TonB-dependent receptor [Lysobacter dokdonensis DS-58]|uniref:TonB-dependent receptor n=1 Tax=Lysobacter dokdonensis DS-58 TaxID=1300345 RepID=A0A0A2WJZ8_9GAMM|nr:TonB-dependent receptor plug domain-containing protein [Lysobacter dokdonensis]KGQ20506.1 TonB-dependent receptor [Lysobacter dokdonensis DS-58]
MHLKRWRGALLCAALLPLSISQALAQDAAAPPDKPAVENAARTYTPDDFTRFAPNNALDMLEQVPGFVIRTQVVERGLGQATGNVLINGQRISAKSNDVLSQLGRIPANNVVRIEIVDGATLDIPGLSGQVANVVTKAAGISGQWEWRPDIRRDFTNPQLTRGNVSVSGAAGRMDWTVGFTNNANHSGAGGPTVIYNADGTVRENRNDEWTGESDNPTLSTQLAWTTEQGSKGNFNGRYQRVIFDYVEEGIRVGDPTVPDRFRTVLEDEGGYNWELGGDYEFKLGPGRLKLIGLDRYTHDPLVDTVYDDYLDAATPTDGARFRRIGNETERIARSEYRWKGFGGDLQVSGEYAFNKLESASTLSLFDGIDDFIIVPLPNGTATVQEDRYELMTSYGRALTQDLQLQVNLGGEYSRLEQVGAGGLTRTFRRPKGLVSFAWKQSENTDWNFKLERRVGQLNFYDFIASVNLTNDQANAGNPDLVPPQTWELSVEANRKLGAWGTTTLRVYGQRIDDIVDTIPIGLDGESPGNLEEATLYGFEWKGTINLDPIGWKGAKIDATWQMEHSSVQDPLTFEDRPISNNLAELASIALRHDIPNTDWAWGGAIDYSYYELDYRLTEVGRQWEGPIWGNLFVERKNLLGMTIRLQASNLGDAMSMWDRTVYVDRRTGPIDFHEMRNRTIGPIYSITFSGKF